MEGLKLRSFIVTGLFLATAGWAAVTARPQAAAAGRDETWMKKVAPTVAGHYRFTPGGEEPGASYKSPKMVYDVLRPTVGILSRVYPADGHSFDVTLIASRDRTSFHDPRVCFSAQNYNLLTDEAVEIETKTRGKIPATLAQMRSPTGDSIAIFFYRGPKGFYGTTMKLKWALLWDQLQGRNDLDGVFYRFISLDAPDRQRLLDFVADYMDASGKESGGYF